MFNFFKKDKKEYWSMTEGVFNCLIDDDRTNAFKKVIEKTVKEGDVVVDMGTGTGVLAMIAAKSGAKKVYAVEIDENNIRTLKDTFELNNLSNKIEIIKGDVTKVVIPEKVDVVIGEMIATGLIEELQIPAMNNILKYVNDDVKVVLEKYNSYVDLVDNNNKYYDLEFNVVRYEYPDEDNLISDSYTDKIVYSAVDFKKQNIDNVVNFSTDLKIKKEGYINGVRISGVTIFCDKSQFEGSFAYSYPVILPINKIKVNAGDVYVLNLTYNLCEGFRNLNYSLTKK